MFDGAADILRAWGAGLQPDPDLTVSEWADRHRMLSGRASAEPGRYRTARTPYMGEIMDRLSPGDRDAADRVHEGRSGRRDGSWKQLDLASRSTRRRGRCWRSSRRWNWPSATRASGSTR